MREYAKKPESQSHTLDSNPKAFRQAPIDVILRRYQERNIQRYTANEELIQGEFDTAQQEEIDEGELLQGKFESVFAGEKETLQREEKSNNTGLSDNLKTGIEYLSGYNMDDIKVHYNSDKPAQLQALAYAQGTDIHIAPGQEKHLPHEVWHVVQQKQGRVQPVMQLQGMNINDNDELEREADIMGMKASSQSPKPEIDNQSDQTHTLSFNTANIIPIQKITIKGVNNGKKMNSIQAFQKVMEKDVKKWCAENNLEWEIVEPRFKSYGSSDCIFENIDHFYRALKYDILTKSNFSAQEEWTTEYGWKRRASGDYKVKEEGPVFLYRTMDMEEYDALKSDDPKMTGHVGDFKEALNYLYKDIGKPKCLVEFEFNVNSIRELFKQAAYPKDLTGGVKLVVDGLKKEDSSFVPSKKANADQGYASNAVGLKSERHGESKFSLGIGKGEKPSKIFMSKISKMRKLAEVKDSKVTWIEDSTEVTDSTGSTTATPQNSKSSNSPIASLATELHTYLNQATKIVPNPQVAESTQDDKRVMADESIATSSDPSTTQSRKGYADESNWQILDNPGRGDCLFFALNASNDQTDANRLREEVVLYQSDNSLIQQGLVDNQLESMLRLSPYQELRNLSDMASGVENIPISAYFRLMANQGTWGGRSEVAAFTAMRGTRVYVLESRGVVTEYINGQGRPEIEQLPDNAFDDGMIVLFKTVDHWKRVLGRKTCSDLTSG
ncbi:hypothetical protein FACS1894155_08370 [Bacteroidia bacterium]|nr:hypothetical protein FACS1894155_08370 [Bacteroidia bacterium]